VLADAQTSGGMLIAAPDPGALEDALRARSLPVQAVGTVVEGPGGSIAIAGRLSAAQE
jgi:hypothetical protein